MKKIGVLTSGGDAPGMNAALRAITKTAFAQHIECIGFLNGYDGLVENNHVVLKNKSIANIIHRGGTILKTARSKAFLSKEGREKAFQTIQSIGIDAMIVIGGDGTFTGAEIFGNEFDIPMVGLPGTIDNDLFGTDYTIGYDTALNTVIQCVDKIRDTALSHHRLFVVEVMGKDAGFIALRSGIASGAEAVLVPEFENQSDQLVQRLKQERRKDKQSGIVIVAEGDDSGGGSALTALLKEHLPLYDIRLTVLGHIQRGGSPSALDRVLASKLGVRAVNALLENRKGVALGVKGMDVSETPFSKAIKHNKTLKANLVELIAVLGQ